MKNIKKITSIFLFSLLVFFAYKSTKAMDTVEKQQLAHKFQNWNTRAPAAILRALPKLEKPEDQEGEITLISPGTYSHVVTEQELIKFFRKHGIPSVKAKKILTAYLIKLLSKLRRYDIVNVRKCASALIKAGAQVNKFVDNNVDSPKFKRINALEAAALMGSPDMISFLLAHGAQVNLANKKGVTPLIAALAANNYTSQTYNTMVQLLIEHGAQVNAKTTDDATALSYACARDLKQTLFYLIENGASFNALSAPHKSIVFAHITYSLEGYALLGGVERLESLENKSVYDEVFTSNALVYAAVQGHTFMVEKLLKYATTKSSLVFMLSAPAQKACSLITCILARQHTSLSKETQENYSRIFKRLKEFEASIPAQPPFKLMPSSS